MDDAPPVTLEAMVALASPGRYRVLSALADGPGDDADLADRLDRSAFAVGYEAGGLVAAGLADREGDRYVLTAAGRALADVDRSRVVVPFAASVVALVAGAALATVAASTEVVPEIPGIAAGFVLVLTGVWAFRTARERVRQDVETEPW